MIIVKDKEVQVIKKINNNTFKEVRILFFVCMILSFLIFISFKIFGLFIFMMSTILFLISQILYKKEWPEKKIISFSKDTLIIYLKNKEKVIDTSKIVNFSYISNSSVYRDNVFVNYINENGKKKSHILKIRGKDAYDFTITANGLIDNNFSNIHPTEDITYLNENKSVDEIFDSLKKGNTVFAKLIGKTKLLIRNGNNYTFESISSLVFITKELVVFYMYIPQLIIDFSQIKIGYDYTIKYSNNSKFSISLSNSQLFIDENDIKKVKNTLEIKNDTLFDEEKIKQELEYERKYIKHLKIIKSIIFTDFILIFILYLCKKEFIKTYLYIFGFLFIGCLIYLVIIILQIKRKCMKLYK